MSRAAYDRLWSSKRRPRRAARRVPPSCSEVAILGLNKILFSRYLLEPSKEKWEIHACQYLSQVLRQLQNMANLVPEEGAHSLFSLSTVVEPAQC